MAEDKKGFILYADLIHTVEQLASDKAGDLFKHILRYVNDKDPVSEDILINIAFEPIKVTVKDTVTVKDILKRKKVFRSSISKFIKDNPNKYPKQLYIDFEEYWTEHGEKDKKMRFEKQKTFGLSRRLSSWSKTGFNDYTPIKKNVVPVPHWNKNI